MGQPFHGLEGPSFLHCKSRTGRLLNKVKILTNERKKFIKSKLLGLIPNCYIPSLSSIESMTTAGVVHRALRGAVGVPKHHFIKK